MSNGDDSLNDQDNEALLRATHRLGAISEAFFADKEGRGMPVTDGEPMFDVELNLCLKARESGLKPSSSKDTYRPSGKSSWKVRVSRA
jgi:hypothetical protein